MSGFTSEDSDLIRSSMSEYQGFVVLFVCFKISNDINMSFILGTILHCLEKHSLANHETMTPRTDCGKGGQIYSEYSDK